MEAGPGLLPLLEPHVRLKDLRLAGLGVHWTQLCMRVPFYMVKGVCVCLCVCESDREALRVAIHLDSQQAPSHHCHTILPGQTSDGVWREGGDDREDDISHQTHQ